MASGKRILHLRKYRKALPGSWMSDKDVVFQASVFLSVQCESWSL